jgi:hypothetical protein
VRRALGRFWPAAAIAAGMWLDTDRLKVISADGVDLKPTIDKKRNNRY